jgi:hypothetical protein
MRPFVPTSFRWFAALALTCFALQSDAQQQPTSRKATGIDFSEPKAPATTSTNQADTKDKPLELRGLDSPIRKPFDIFNAADSFSGAAAPAPRRHVQPSPAEAKRIKEALDRKKNWAFGTPEDIFGVAHSDDDLEAGLEGDVSKTSLERFLERDANRRSTAISNHLSHDRETLRGLFGAEEDEKETDERQEKEKPVLSLLTEPAGQLPGIMAVPGVSSIGGAGQPFANLGGPQEKSWGTFDVGQPAKLESSLVRSAVQEENMKQFKEALESRALPSTTPATTLNPILAPPLHRDLAPPPSFSFGNPAGAGSQIGSSLLPAAPPTAFGVAMPSLSGILPTQNLPPPPAPAARFTPATSFEMPLRKF